MESQNKGGEVEMAQDEVIRLQGEIDSLRKTHQEVTKENKLLQGKIRGYQTLGQLLQDYKKKCTKYEYQIAHLQKKITSGRAEREDIDRGSLATAVSGSAELMSETHAAVAKTTPESSPVAASGAETETERETGGKNHVVSECQGPQGTVGGQLGDVAEQSQDKYQSTTPTTEEHPLPGTDMPPRSSSPPQSTGRVREYKVNKMAQSSDLVQQLHTTKRSGDKEETDAVGQDTEQGPMKTRVPSSYVDLSSTQASQVGESVSGTEQKVPSAPPTDENIEASYEMPNMTDRYHTQSGFTSSSMTLPPMSSSKSSQQDMYGEQEPDRVDSLTDQVRQAFDQMRNIAGDGDSNVLDLFAQLTTKALRTEKELKLKKTLIDSLTEENEKLKDKLVAQASERDRRIAALLKDHEHMEGKLSERQQDRHSLQGPSSMASVELDQRQWVHVERQSRGGSTSNSPKLETVLLDSSGKEMSQKEILQQRRIETLHSKNRELAMRCQNLEDQLKQAKEQLASKSQRLEEYRSQEERRQQDIDRMLLSAKKRVEVEEAERQNALQSVYEERRQRLDAEKEADHFREQVDALRTQNNALLQDVEELRSRNEELRAQTRQLHDAQVERLISDGRGQQWDCRAATIEELQTQVQVLQQQVTIYKDDFTTERNDRERAQAEKEELSQQLQSLTQDLQNQQLRNNSTESNVQKLQSENNRLTQQLLKRNEELTRLQYQLPAPPAYTPQNAQVHVPLRRVASENTARNVYVLPMVMPPLNPSSAWSCRRCTYQNRPERMYCDMCGKSRASQPANTGHHNGEQIPLSVENITPADTERQQRLVSHGVRGSAYRGGADCIDAPRDTNM